MQPRRLALLAYLAASTGPFQRRDRLLLLFWGEQPETRARASLRQALYFIRRSLGDDVLLTRGDDEVGLNPAAIRVDVTELELSIADGNAERALALYQGDFLADFNIDGAPEFERWATDRRRDLRRSVVGAAWQLCDTSLGAGSHDLAIRWARRAVDLAEYAEHDVRRAMRTIATAGNRSAALEMYETLRERLAADLETKPETETTSLVNELRAAAGLFDHRNGLPAARVIDIGHHDRGAFGSEQQAGGAAHSRTAAGNNRDFVCHLRHEAAPTFPSKRK